MADRTVDQLPTRTTLTDNDRLLVGDVNDRITRTATPETVTQRAIAPITDTHFVIKDNASGNFVNSALRETSEMIISDKSLQVPNNSIDFDTVVVSAIGGQVIFFNKISNSYFLAPSRELLPSGTASPQMESAAARSMFDAFTRIDVTHTQPEIGWNFTEQLPAILDGWELRRGTGKFYVQIHYETDGSLPNANSPVLYRSHQEFEVARGDGYDLSDGTGDTVFFPASGPTDAADPETARRPFFVPQDLEIFIRLISVDGTDIDWVGGTTVAGDAANGFPVLNQAVPFNRTRFWLISFEDILVDSNRATKVNDVIVAGNQLTKTFDSGAGTITLDWSPGPPGQLSPELTSLSVDIPSRVDENTNLNVATDVTFTVADVTDLTGNLTLHLLNGDDKTITLPTADGTHTVSVTLTGIDTSSATTLNFQLRGTATDGRIITSNTYRVTVRTPLAQEQAYWYTTSTQADYATVDLATTTTADVTQPGSDVQLSGSLPAGNFLYILFPQNRPLTQVRDTSFNTVIPSSVITGVRTIGGLTYNVLAVQNNGPTGTINNWEAS